MYEVRSRNIFTSHITLQISNDIDPLLRQVLEADSTFVTTKVRSALADVMVLIFPIQAIEPLKEYLTDTLTVLQAKLIVSVLQRCGNIFVLLTPTF